MIVQHVLVPIDFSATADQALAYAIALAQCVFHGKAVLARFW